jgi:hypothetical protein
MDTEKQFVTGFNNGYLIAKYEPAISSKITKNLQPAAGYLEGFLAGKEEYEIENIKSQEKDLEQIRARSNDREKDLEKD